MADETDAVEAVEEDPKKVALRALVETLPRRNEVDAEIIDRLARAVEDL